MQRQYRLKKRSAFAYVYRKGERTAAKDIALLAAKSREGLKIGLSVSKKVGNAVTRNRVKRLLRESLAPLTERIDARFMYVVVAYPTLVGKSLDEIKAVIRKAFEKSGKLK